jgi:hypothetical protein
MRVCFYHAEIVVGLINNSTPGRERVLPHLRRILIQIVSGRHSVVPDRIKPPVDSSAAASKADFAGTSVSASNFSSRPNAKVSR